MICQFVLIFNLKTQTDKFCPELDIEHENNTGFNNLICIKILPSLYVPRLTLLGAI